MVLEHKNMQAINSCDKFKSIQIYAENTVTNLDMKLLRFEARTSTKCSQFINLSLLILFL